MMFRINKQVFNVFAACAITAFGLCGCANEDAAANQTEDQQKGLAFSGLNGEKSIGTRTGASYGEINTNHELGVNFYWSKDDYKHLFINAGTDASPNWLPFTGQFSVDSTDVYGKKRVTKASFRCITYPDVYLDQVGWSWQKKIRYIGTSNAVSQVNTVTIPRVQKQSEKGFAERIGQYGDCAVATANNLNYSYFPNRPSGQQYLLTECSFTLQHKAAYLTFMPYNLPGAMANTYLQWASIYAANQALSGSYKFDDNGIDTSTRPGHAGYRTVRLEIEGNGLPIAKNRMDARSSAGIMVVAPGEYDGVVVKMYIKDVSTGNDLTIEKSYAKLELKAGLNQTVFHSLNIPDYTTNMGLHHMWGAADFYWDEAHPQPTPHEWQFSSGVGSIPAPAAPNDKWPKDNSDPRWYSTDLEFPSSYIVGGWGNLNVNDASYILNANCYWDANAVWTFDGHMFKGIMWVPRVTVGHAAAYDGTDWSATATTKSIAPTLGTPPTGGNYVALPALGYYENGALKDVGKIGCYWINCANPDNDQDEAYSLEVSSTGVKITPATSKSKGYLVLRP